MSNETMTDAQIIERVDGAIGALEFYGASRSTIGQLRGARAIIQARLRGEAAPEGQAVAWLDGDFAASLDRNGSATVWKHKGAARNAVAAYTRPQPVAVAGDAVRRIADEIDPRTDPSPRPWREIADELRSLSSPAAPAPVAGDAVAALIDALSSDHGGDHHDEGCDICMAIAALAQDRASQAGAADDMEAKAEEYRRIHAEGEAHGRNMATLEATQPPAVGVDVTDEMVERAAEAIWNVPAGRLCWPPRREGMADEWRAFARAALHAALRTGGGE